MKFSPCTDRMRRPMWLMLVSRGIDSKRTVHPGQSPETLLLYLQRGSVAGKSWDLEFR
jgi:hypothetical protein